MIELKQLEAAAWARRVLTDTDSGREAARAYFYGLECGVPQPIIGRFNAPTCGNRECLSTEHQSWAATPPPQGSISGARASNGRART
jgi:hypothetical protein